MVLTLPAKKSAKKNNVERKVEVNVAYGGVKAEPDPEEFWTKYLNLSESLRVGSCSNPNCSNPRIETMVAATVRT